MKLKKLPFLIFAVWLLTLSLFLFACGRVVEETPSAPVAPELENAAFDETRVTTEEVAMTLDGETITVTREIVSNQVIIEAVSGVSENTIQANLPAGYEMIGKNSAANTYQIRIPTVESVSSAITTLSSVSGVSNAGANPVVTVCYTPDDDSFTSNWVTDRWGFISVEAKTAWDLTQGSSGVTMAIVDTGLDLDHDDFSGRIDTEHKQNFIAGDLNPEDDSGHGTTVAGIAAASGDNDKHIAGMDWNCKIMAIKAVGSSGKGDGFSAVNAICYAAAQGAKVINCSFGIYLDEDIAKDRAMIKHFEGAAEVCVDFGSLLVAAAGNENRDASNFYPAALSTYANTPAIAVGGIGYSGGRWLESTTEASNYGSAVNISAPANKIYSTWPYGSKVVANKQGTSLAAPFVCGTASLILSLPEVSLTVFGLRDSILEGSDTISADKSIGVRLNAWKAILKALYYSNKSVLTVSSNPDGATIYVDGVSTGKTTTSNGTRRLIVGPGSHTIKLTLSGYSDREESVSFTKGEEKELSWSLTSVSPTTTTSTSTTTTQPSGGVSITGDPTSYLAIDNGNFWIRTNYSTDSARQILDQVGRSGQSSNWLKRSIGPAPCLTQSTQSFYDGVRNRSLSILKDSTNLCAYQTQFEAYYGNKELRVTWKFIVPAGKEYAIWVASFESTGTDKSITIDNAAGEAIQDVYFLYPIQPSTETNAYLTCEGDGVPVSWSASFALDYYNSSSNRHFSVYNSDACLTIGYFSGSTDPYQFYLNSFMGYKSMCSTIKLVELDASSPTAQWIGVLAFHSSAGDATSLFEDAESNLSSYLSQIE